MCEIIPGLSAAESNQFDVGDVVLYIDEVLVRSITLVEVKILTIGEVGTTVTLVMRSVTEVSSFVAQTPRLQKYFLTTSFDLPLTCVCSFFLFVRIENITVEICHIFMTLPLVRETNTGTNMCQR